MFGSQWFESSPTSAFQSETRQESDNDSFFPPVSSRATPSDYSRFKRKYTSKDRLDHSDDSYQDCEPHKNAIGKLSLEHTFQTSPWASETTPNGVIEYSSEIQSLEQSTSLSNNFKPKRICVNKRSHPWQKRDDTSFGELDDSVSDLDDGFSKESKLSLGDEERDIADTQSPVSSLRSDPKEVSYRNVAPLTLSSQNWSCESIRMCTILKSDPTNFQLQCHGHGDDPYSVMTVTQQSLENSNMQLIVPLDCQNEMDEHTDIKMGTEKRMLTAESYFLPQQRSAKRARANEDGNYYSVKEDMIVVAVEASCICKMDSAVRQGLLNEDIALPFVPGCNFVGTVQCCGPEAASHSVFVGKRVAGFVKYGGNQRYISISSDNLIPVPESVCVEEASCLVSTYLPAFQALHHGMSPAFRYSRNCLRGKTVFVTDADSLEGQAVVRLAYWAGAEEVYAAGDEYGHDRLRSLGATVFSDDPDDYLPHIGGLVDVIVHLHYPQDLSAVQSALKPDSGRLVCFARPYRKKEEPGFSWITEMENWCMDASLTFMDRASVYNPYQSLEHYPNQFQKDSTFLFMLLEERHIRPKIEQIISLEKVPQAHDELDCPETCPRGATICNPWA